MAGLGGLDGRRVGLSLSQTVAAGSGVSAARLVIDSSGPYLLIYTGSGEERYTWRFGGESSVPRLMYTDEDGGQSTLWTA